MEAADSDVDDARRELRAVVGRDRNPAERDIREVGLREADGKRSTHGSHHKHRANHGARVDLSAL
jgi:hypothetical protein